LTGTEAVAPVVTPPVLATVHSLAEFAATIMNETRGGVQRWFRGTRSESHKLIPSLYRHPTVLEPNALIELEWELLSNFRQQAPPFVGEIPSKELELLFLMQHYRVPTRLLDWSENPFVSLFFALENCREERAGEEANAAVWLLDPIKMNSIATTGQEGEARIFGAFADELEGYRPRREGKAVNRLLPLAIYGIHNSPRIVAQRGTFTIFGKDITPIDSSEKTSGADGCVKKIIINRNCKREIFSDLFGVGISDSVVYPDLDGLGRELRNRRGF
jgi:hypothetical protein